LASVRRLSVYLVCLLRGFPRSVVERRSLDADPAPDPTFYFDAYGTVFGNGSDLYFDPNLDPDPDPTPSLTTHIGKSEKLFFAFAYNNASLHFFIFLVSVVVVGVIISVILAF
jgi:hypothetical protein